MGSVYDKGLIAADKDRIVSMVVVTASGTGSTIGGQRTVFHWRYYLKLAPELQKTTNSMAVLFDMIPTLPPQGTFSISSKPLPGSAAIFKIELPIATVGSPTVKQFIDLFLSKGMHRYNFDESGSGCLYWTWVGLQYLQDAGMVESGAIARMEAFHKEQVALHPERHPIPIRQGQFY